MGKTALLYSVRHELRGWSISGHWVQVNQLYLKRQTRCFSILWLWSFLEECTLPFSSVNVDCDTRIIYHLHFATVIDLYNKCPWILNSPISTNSWLHLSSKSSQNVSEFFFYHSTLPPTFFFPTSLFLPLFSFPSTVVSKEQIPF